MKLNLSKKNLALKFLYSGLDLKASKIESQFREAFKTMLDFVDIYLASKGQTFNQPRLIISFNKDLVMNESEYIDNIGKSSDLSLETRLAMHPWVNDVVAELERLADEKNAQAFALKDIDNEA